MFNIRLCMRHYMEAIMRKTEWNDNLNGYVVRLYENETINFYEDTVEETMGRKIIRSVAKYIGGNIIELLAEYEDTGLTPEEIRQLKYIDFKKLQESNAILRKKIMMNIMYDIKSCLMKIIF